MKTSQETLQDVVDLYDPNYSIIWEQANSPGRGWWLIEYDNVEYLGMTTDLAMLRLRGLISTWRHYQIARYVGTLDKQSSVYAATP